MVFDVVVCGRGEACLHGAWKKGGKKRDDTENGHTEQIPNKMELYYEIVVPKEFLELCFDFNGFYETSFICA